MTRYRLTITVEGDDMDCDPLGSAVSNLEYDGWEVLTCGVEEA